MDHFILNTIVLFIFACAFYQISQQLSFNNWSVVQSFFQSPVYTDSRGTDRLIFFPFFQYIIIFILWIAKNKIQDLMYYLKLRKIMISKTNLVNSTPSTDSKHL